MSSTPEITIYTKVTCSYCHMAKDLLKKLNLPFTEVSVDNNNELRQKLQRDNNGYSTVPMIFINGKFIGGYSDLAKLASTSTLQRCL